MTREEHIRFLALKFALHSTYGIVEIDTRNREPMFQEYMKLRDELQEEVKALKKGVEKL